MVIVRRQGFANDQWVLEGMNLLDLKYTRAGYYSSPTRRSSSGRTIAMTGSSQLNTSLRSLPRNDFDYRLAA